MISLINGTVRSLTSDRAIVEVGGVGLSITITPGTSALLNIGASAQFYTCLVVREESLTLFGFLDDGARALWTVEAAPIGALNTFQLERDEITGSWIVKQV